MVHLSKLFNWYHNDFGKSKEEILRWVQSKVAQQDKKDELGKVIESGEFRVKDIHYDWGDNEKK